MNAAWHCLPDYQGGSIVNVSASIARACGLDDLLHPPARELAQQDLAANTIVLLLIDGLGYEFLRRQSPNSVFNRHLRASLSSVLPSTTSSAISTMATGLSPRQHAVTGWFMHLRELGAVTAILPFMPRIGGEILSKYNVSMADLLDMQPLFKHFDRPAYVLMPDWIVDSPYSRLAFAGSRRQGYDGLDDWLRQLAQLTAEPQRKFVYGYWPELDHLCHEHGVGSTEVAAHFSRLEKAFETFFETISGHDASVIIVADHGLVDTGNDRVIQLEDHPELRDCLSHPLCGEPRLAYCYVRPRATERFQRYVETRLSHCCECYRSEELVKAGWFGPGWTHPELLPRLGDYCLVMKDNYVIKDRLLGERAFHQVGVHGGVSSAEMRVPLIVKRA